MKLVWGWLLYLSVGPFAGFYVGAYLIPPLPDGPNNPLGLLFLGCVIWAAACQGTQFIVIPWREARVRGRPIP
jgi:hypothetical protein